jgi:hypothetical protein
MTGFSRCRSIRLVMVSAACSCRAHQRVPLMIDRIVDRFKTRLGLHHEEEGYSQ